MDFTECLRKFQRQEQPYQRERIQSTGRYYERQHLRNSGRVLLERIRVVVPQRQPFQERVPLVGFLHVGVFHRPH